MEIYDDELEKFEAEGTSRRCPPQRIRLHRARGGPDLVRSPFGSGAPVILLHGGLGHSGNWGYQVPVLVRKRLPCSFRSIAVGMAPQHARLSTLYI